MLFMRRWHASFHSAVRRWTGSDTQPFRAANSQKCTRRVCGAIYIFRRFSARGSKGAKGPALGADAGGRAGVAWESGGFSYVQCARPSPGTPPRSEAHGIKNLLLVVAVEERAVRPR